MCFRVLLVVGLWDSLKILSTRKCKKIHLDQFFARSMSAWWPGAESQRVPFMERQQVCLGSRPVIQIRFIGWSRCVYMWVPVDFESLGINHCIHSRNLCKILHPWDKQMWAMSAWSRIFGKVDGPLGSCPILTEAPSASKVASRIRTRI